MHVMRMKVHTVRVMRMDSSLGVTDCDCIPANLILLRQIGIYLKRGLSACTVHFNVLYSTKRTFSECGL